ncbi:O-antigen ligase family protein, partial [Escherichia coli]|nr:O-antigen ligase family protein [Escherichia coli]
FISRLLWLAAAFFMVAGILVTQSRGGFLGLLASSGVLIWKFGKQHRAKALIGGLVALLFVLLLMPGNYGLRMASIF